MQATGYSGTGQTGRLKRTSALDVPADQEDFDTGANVAKRAMLRHHPLVLDALGHRLKIFSALV